MLLQYQHENSIPVECTMKTKHLNVAAISFQLFPTNIEDKKYISFLII